MAVRTYVQPHIHKYVCVYPFPCIVLHACGGLYSMACLITGWCAMYVRMYVCTYMST